MNPSTPTGLIAGLWLALIAYLIASAMGVKRDTQGHWRQSLVLTFAILAAFLLPHVRIFNFLDFAPLNPVVSSIGVIGCVAGMIVAGRAFVFLLVFLGPIFLWRVGAEDRLMERQFPTEFPDYKKRTKGIMPFVW